MNPMNILIQDVMCNHLVKKYAWAHTSSNTCQLGLPFCFSMVVLLRTHGKMHRLWCILLVDVVYMNQLGILAKNGNLTYYWTCQLETM